MGVRQDGREWRRLHFVRRVAGLLLGEYHQQGRCSVRRLSVDVRRPVRLCVCGLKTLPTHHKHPPSETTNQASFPFPDCQTSVPTTTNHLTRRTSEYGEWSSYIPTTLWGPYEFVFVCVLFLRTRQPNKTKHTHTHSIKMLVVRHHFDPVVGAGLGF